MNRNIAIFLGGFLLSLPFWWGTNALSERLEEFFFFSELAQNPQLFTAQAALEQQLDSVLPLQKRNAPLELGAASGLSVFVNQGTGESKVLFEKNSELRLPIASLTKLMGALVVARHYPLEETITISREAVAEEEDFGQLKEGDRILVKDLLYPMLMESSNDASAAFALKTGMADFLEAMNREASLLGLADTRFYNHAGLDPDNPQGAVNYSSARDLFLLTQYLKTFHPSVFDILGRQSLPLYTADGVFHHEMVNTNQLLSSNGWPTRVLGGKTGWTPEAKGTLVLVLESPKGKGYIVNVILGSDNRFHSMEQLVDWVFRSYAW
ncbi:MAG: serine hydrolase [bacterium]|nr:serine hydrolase [bacterium]